MPLSPESLPEARVLVVDDETNIVELLSVSLKFGFEVHTASSGPAALDKAREVRPDAVILDVNDAQEWTDSGCCAACARTASTHPRCS